jgi:hypothetical protein
MGLLNAAKVSILVIKRWNWWAYLLLKYMLLLLNHQNKVCLSFLKFQIAFHI